MAVSRWPVAAAAGFLAFLTAAAYMNMVPFAVFGAYAVLSMAALGMYAMDKSAARSQRWRTRERTLHLLSLLGGWPGALMGQRLFRHKTRKVRFQVIFWLTVLLNCAGLAIYFWQTCIKSGF